MLTTVPGSILPAPLSSNGSAKSAPPVVGLGELLTYTIEAYNRGLTTEQLPVLTDVVPLSTTFVWASDGGVVNSISDTDVISWVLPLLSPGGFDLLGHQQLSHHHEEAPPCPGESSRPLGFPDPGTGTGTANT